MALEIERKYLVADQSFLPLATQADQIIQGYLSTHRPSIRVRLRNREAYLTIKGKSTSEGLVRSEWEYPIPYEEAKEMLAECGTRIVEKTRYLVPYAGKVWEVDVFSGKHAGLILAEIELDDADEEVALPPFVGEEVTHDVRYYNAYMATRDIHPKEDSITN